MEKELRVYDNPVEIRTALDGSEYISGYGVVFNSESQDLGGFIETIAPTAFRETDMSDVIGNFNHDNNFMLGRTPLTLTLTVDDIGVRYDIKPPDTSFAKDLKISIARGDVRGSSFKFNISKDGDTWEKPKERGGLYRRLVTRVAKLWDLGPVSSPAYLSTDATIAKRELGVLKDQEEVEVTEKIAVVDEIERLKVDRQLKQMDVDLAYHNNTTDVERVDREFKKKKRELLKGFDRDFSIVKPEDQLKQFDADFQLNDNERE